VENRGNLGTRSLCQLAHVEWALREEFITPEWAAECRRRIRADETRDLYLSWITFDGDSEKIAAWVEEDNANRRKVRTGMAVDVINHANARAVSPSMRRLVRRVRASTQRRTGTHGRSPGSRRAATRARSPSSSDDDLEPEPPRAASRRSVISTPIEIDLLFACTDPGKLRRAECAYCHQRTRGVHASVQGWFLSHQCDGSVFPAVVHDAIARRNREKIREQGGSVSEVGAVAEAA
jgi:hypothetical protein